MNFLARSFFSLALLMLSTLAPAQDWATQNSNTAQDLNGLFMISDTEGWITGNGGVLLHTVNGGTTWTLLVITNQDLQDVAFRDAQTGIVVGDNGLIFRTVNGGMSWMPIASPTASQLRGVDWGEGDVVWAAGRDGAVIRSTNAGLSWVLVNPPTLERFRRISAIGTSLAWAVGENGAIWHSNNAGLSWQQQSSPATGNVDDVQFLSPTTGFACGNNNLVLHTTNGGQTWTSRNSGIFAGQGGLHFIDENTGWTVGNNGTIFATTNAGLSWTLQNSGTIQNLNEVFFTANRMGWAVGNGGVILHSDQGICTPGILGDVNADNLANSTDGLVVLSFDVAIPLPQPLLQRISLGFGDVNTDILTNSTDALIILSFDAGISTPFPVGQPTCLGQPLQALPTSLPNATTPALNRNARITLSAAPETHNDVGEAQIAIPLTIDLSELPEKLGSYTITLRWNPAALRLKNYSGGKTEGFENPVVNTQEAGAGKLTVAHAYPYGAAGKVNILNLEFEMLETHNPTASLEIDASAMAAAYSFNDLLPYLAGEFQKIEISLAEQPLAYQLDNFPNPFNPATQIRYTLPRAEKVKLEVFNLIGQQVATLVDEYQEAGRHVVEFDARQARLASGVYLYRLQAGNTSMVKRLLLLK